MTIIERVLLLQNIELFKDVTTEQLSFIAAIAEEISVDAGTLLYRENDPPDGLYVVVSGLVTAGRKQDGSAQTARLEFGLCSMMSRG
jgi:CRP-like cAMP-binding protein